MESFSSFILFQKALVVICSLLNKKNSKVHIEVFIENVFNKTVGFFVNIYQRKQSTKFNKIMIKVRVTNFFKNTFLYPVAKEKNTHDFT